MRVCVITDEESLSTRIRQALLAATSYEVAQAIRVDQAESHLARNKYDVVLVATGRSFEHTVATIARLSDFTSCPLLVIGPVSDPRLVLNVLRGGADDYVDEGAVDEELVPALERLKYGRATKSTPGRIHAVLSPSGGGGATTVAANLALAMAKGHERCLAIDLKTRTGDLAAMFDMRPSHTLEDLCRVSSRIDRLLFEQTLSLLPSGIGLLASPRSFESAPSAESVSRILELGRSLYTRVVLDIDPTLPEASVEALRAADSVLVVLRLEFNSLRNAKAVLEHMERRGIDPRKTLLVANRVGQPKEIPAAKIEEALNRKFIAKLPDDPKAAVGSQNNGIPVLTEYPSSRLSKTLLALASVLDALPA